MHVFRVFARAAASVAVLLSTSAVMQAAEISYLTHWAPETVAKLEAAAAAYSASHPGAKITVRAVPFGDLLTTLRSSGSGAHGVTIASIYDAWLPDLVKNQLVAPAPEAIAAETKANWPASVVGAASVGGVPLRHSQRNRPLRAQLQQKAVCRGRHRRAAEDVGRVPRGREEAHRQIKKSAGLWNDQFLGRGRPASLRVPARIGRRRPRGQRQADARTRSRRRRRSSSTRR